MKKLGAVLLLSVLLSGCGDFEWFPDSTSSSTTTTNSSNNTSTPTYNNTSSSSNQTSNTTTTPPTSPIPLSVNGHDFSVSNGTATNGNLSAFVSFASATADTTKVNVMFSIYITNSGTTATNAIVGVTPYDTTLTNALTATNSVFYTSTPVPASGTSTLTGTASIDLSLLPSLATWKITYLTTN